VGLVTVQNRAELSESGQSADEIESGGTALGSPADRPHERDAFLAGDRLAYVEIGEQVERRVGFGAM
jgi:hypothetical protein